MQRLLQVAASRLVEQVAAQASQRHCLCLCMHLRRRVCALCLQVVVAVVRAPQACRPWRLTQPGRTMAWQ